MATIIRSAWHFVHIYLYIVRRQTGRVTFALQSLALLLRQINDPIFNKTALFDAARAHPTSPNVAMSPTRFTRETLQRCYDEMCRLHQTALDVERERATDLEQVAPAWKDSARNLLHYMGLRRCDIRELQIELSRLGLSSLGRLEAHVLAGLESVLFALQRLADEKLVAISERANPTNFLEGDKRLEEHADQLFGPRAQKRSVRIMVTLPSEAADDPQLVRDLMQTGMNIARINTAHDGPAIWQRMVEHIRQTEKDSALSCRIIMDLCGPKLRTGALEPGPSLRRINPPRNARGIVEIPTAIAFYTEPRAEMPADAHTVALPIDADLAAGLEEGDSLRFLDTANRQRTLKITRRENDILWSETQRSIYVESDLPLQHWRGGQKMGGGRIGIIPPAEAFLLVHQNDILHITHPDTVGGPAQVDAAGKIAKPARIPCALPQIFTDVRVGHKILFDDGKIAGRVEEVGSDHLVVRITHAKASGVKLRSNKGINLPDTHLNIPALSAGDLQCLDFAVEHADMIGLSFVREKSDIEQLLRELNRRTQRALGIVLKIETRLGFESLPNLLLAGLKQPPLGVMIARGDLGVEMGFERLAEVQEQILWLCEAAHVPVIWATQVLEQMNKTGLPTRGEVTDAAMSGRAECVMLNKGPHTVATVAFLENILVRMQDHHSKKTPMLRKLKVSEGRWRSA